MARLATFSQDKSRDVHYQCDIYPVPQPVCEPKSSGFGESGPQAAAGCAEPNCQTTPAAPTRPHFLDLALASTGQLALISGCCQACDRDKVAAPRFQNTLAAEVEDQQGRAPQNLQRDPGSHQANVPGKSYLGSAPDTI